MQVYLDNAATTPMDERVFEAMKPYFFESFGNPSSIHAHGRKTKSAVEESRKQVASLLNASAAEIFFTSGGTESDNMALRCTVEKYDIKHVITSPLEHHAVLHPLEDLEKKERVQVNFLNVNEQGDLDLKQLEQLLKKFDGPCLVSVMHGNNELGNLNDIERIGDLCRVYNAFFHTDTTQTIAHYPFDVQTLNVDFLVGSAHKFHGPKGVGFIYINQDKVNIDPFIYGGAQERNMRGGTENVPGIVGLATALELSHTEMKQDHEHIQALKSRLMEGLKNKIPGVSFNGRSAETGSLYTVLNVSLPESDFSDMLVFTLDINSISASGGSACASGSDIGSHVLDNLNIDTKRGNIRFSLSKFNTAEEIDYVVEKLEEMYREKA